MNQFFKEQAEMLPERNQGAQRSQNPATLITMAVELLIKLVLVLPYTMFKVIEPLLQFGYD